MRIGFVSQPWAGLHPPTESTAIWTREVGAELVRRGHEVTVFAAAIVDQPGTYARDGVTHTLVPLRADWRLQKVLGALPARARKPAFSWALSHREYAWRVARAAKEHRFNSLHVHNFSQFLPVLRSRARPKATVVHMHCEWLSSLDRRMIDRRLRAADLILGCSDHVSSLTRAAHPRHAERCRTVPNGVDPALFRPAEGSAADGLPSSR